jgi:hypothetical protein
MPCPVRFVTYVSRPDKLNAGAARGIRTPDPIITNDVLYRLSYCGINDLAWELPLCVRTMSASQMTFPGNWRWRARI